MTRKQEIKFLIKKRQYDAIVDQYSKAEIIEACAELDRAWRLKRTARRIFGAIFLLDPDF